MTTRPVEGPLLQDSPEPSNLPCVPLRLMVALMLTAGLAGCASTEESADDDESRPARIVEEPRFAPRAEGIGTVQLYRTGDEASLPVHRLQSGHTLTLAFDLVRQAGRPLSVYFYHADRTWRRDLVPAEYLSSFHRDDILDYRSSQGTQVPYTHFRYEFPNATIGFRISGNYIVRVTEQGMEDDILFERAFFVSEQATPVDFSIGRVMVAGSPTPYLQPSLSFTPPDPTYGNAFDYTVCFQRNGMVDDGRCTDDPSLAMAPELSYYLEPEYSFGPKVSEYFLDISTLSVGGRVERTDTESTPFRMIVEPDYIRFPGSLGAPLLNGNPVVGEAVSGFAEPHLSAEYVVTQFSLVPENDTPVGGNVYLLGPFNDWTRDADHRMVWNGAVGRYEGSALMKLGLYEYRYGFSNESVARQVAMDAPPRLDNMLTAFVYFSDVRVSTDRLITAVSVRTQ